jgi:hypothetical protein
LTIYVDDFAKYTPNIISEKLNILI